MHWIQLSIVQYVSSRKMCLNTGPVLKKITTKKTKDFCHLPIGLGGMVAVTGFGRVVGIGGVGGSGFCVFNLVVVRSVVGLVGGVVG